MEICPRCKHKPRLFKRHDVRQRRFLVAVERLIVEVISFLVRMKCSYCGRTFTEYPPFARPYKRFVSDEIMERSLRYLQEDTMTYKRAACKPGTSEIYGRSPPLPIYYPDSDTSRQLAPSTVHRWITTLSVLDKTLQAAVSLLLEKGDDMHRQVVDVAARKYRSEARKRCLQDALRLFHCEARFRVVFNRSIFPELATRYCWQ
jgi:hypothetical protein